jgi:indole-3-glycerol phosphate synthase
VILDEIVAHKRQQHAERAPIALDQLWARVAALPSPRPLLLPRLSLIAEFKRRSPSAGDIAPGADPRAVAKAYEAAGAMAISVLTDEKFFGGAMADLAAAQAACGLPILRKDFLLDERDLLEARLGGADAVLLIVRILPKAMLRALIEVARRAHLAALVEAHSDGELETALAAGATVLGVNHRDLDTLAIDLSLSARARALAPDATIVAESGIQSRADVDKMREHGVDAILVGEALMRAPDPGAALRELIA